MFSFKLTPHGACATLNFTLDFELEPELLGSALVEEFAEPLENETGQSY